MGIRHEECGNQTVGDCTVSGSFGARTDARQNVTLRVDPKIVLSSQLLELNQAELESAIANELAENPALERLHDDDEIVTDEAILRTIAPRELMPSSEDFEFRRSLPQGSSESVDWLDFAASSNTLWEHLQAQLSATLPKSLRHVGAFLVGCIDERGYLTTTAEEVALHCDCSLEEAETAITKLQACEPAGVGASNVRECLLLQLRDDDSVEAELARSILETHFDDFLARNVRGLMRRYRVHPEVIEAAFQEITSLTPYPGEMFGDFASRSSDPALTAASPDISLHFDPSGWTIEVKGLEPADLTVSRAYRDRLAKLQQMSSAPKDEKRHITEYVDRASRFIESLKQRKLTLRRIGEYLVQKQAGFVSTGEYQFLAPLTRTQVARELGVHESTISRATMDKFVQLATGEIVSFEVFFKPALRVQKMIEEILAQENPNSPLSDERIAQLLAEKGIVVARRTVNKYRDRTKLLSSRRRRSA